TSFVGNVGGNTLWNPTYFHQGMRRWIKFSDRNSNRYQNDTHDLGTVTGYLNDPSSPDYNSADAAISSLLDGEFVSLFAALSPEEDFVETYKYKILADVAHSSNLQLHIPGVSSPVPVLDKVTNAAGNLQSKISCVTSLTP